MSLSSFNLYHQFSCPQTPFDERVFDAISVSFGVAVVECFLQRRRDLIAARSRGIIELVESWLGDAADPETVWDQAFGRTDWAMESSEADTGDVATQLALRLSSRGQPGQWHSILSRPMRLRFEGWLLPQCTEIDLQSDGNTVFIVLKVENSGTENIGFERTEFSWTSSGAQRLSYAKVNTPIFLMAQSAIEGQLTIDDQFGSITGYPEVTGNMVQNVQKALDILAKYAPQYLQWVERVIRGIVVCQCKETRTRSSTWSEAPGIILMSVTDDPITIAEMMVHEASHQYFHLLRKLGAVDDGSDTCLYYSPAVSKERPLSRILIAYHAFANILLMYRTTRLNGLVDSGECLRMENRMQGDIGLLGAPLHANPALTPLGNALYQPLAQRAEGLDGGG
ncbi:HEXXH motif-containing protein [Collimonas sp. OK242]|uniref:aKG-HExxH-type peptide beta-hydroxylase n=1 Tax=Collimonas sp. OK242 TaxID=1798195 RepID=UPI000899F86A|nr:HEXXH motif-containing putative peptide modification protein [Collimonas sp. OK242]SDY98249.1 HEXXH motif-containing protein [Collimonas sp. OK242]